MSRTIRRAVLAAALAAALGGCATLSPQASDEDINNLLAARHGPAVEWSKAGQPAAERQSISRWLEAPMTADSAVRVAMLRSPRLQQEFARLGLARAEVLEAVQVANPRLSLAREYPDPGSGYNRIAGLSLPLVDLLVLPMRTRLAQLEFKRAQLEIAGAVLGVAADVEAAWYRYVGAQQVADMRSAVAEASAASAELAQRFYDAGNISELQLRQEQAADTEARIEAARARAEAGRARLALNTALGLSGDEAGWKTADRLPMPVAEEDDPRQLAALARESNLELLAARQQAEVLADALGMTRKLRWLGGSEIGYEQEKDADGSRLRGPSLSLELPLFNQGQAKLARSEALLAEALARVAMAELAVDSAVRLGSQEVRELGNVVALHRDALIPQREKVVERSQQEQNFMLIGVFELVQAKVKEYDAYQGYLEAVRDYWLARVELMRALGQRLPSDQGIAERTPSVQDILAPAATVDHSKMDHGKMDHSGHAMPPAKPAEVDHSKMDHSGHAMPPAKPAEVDHSKMDHSGHAMPPAKPAEVDQSKMDHSGHAMPPAEPAEVDHSKMDHGSHAPPSQPAPAESDDDAETTHDHESHGGQP